VDGQVTWIKVHSQMGGDFCLANPWEGARAAVVDEFGQSELVSGQVLEITLSAGQSVTIRPI
jgi:hypothetical protein